MRQILEGNNVGDQVFVGDVTGAVNVTKLRQWLVVAGRKVEQSAFTRQNAGELLAAHEFDRSIHSRTEYLLANAEELKKPLIVVHWDNGGVYLIDGWHRLLLTYMGTDTPHTPFLAYHVRKKELKKFRLPVNAIIGDVEYTNASEQA